ncbi:MAG: hypothetical protein NT132_06865 [Microbacterium sp.]|uniref:hypothetical protein n=1 Tax=Microbacterium sp. TaxID=51671 RepID=UPI00260F7609|nr:hypothetical protein [Microbacterium sp.]MCX6502110.1 hypothetical protein [Microbacterium sp.]
MTSASFRVGALVVTALLTTTTLAGCSVVDLLAGGKKTASPSASATPTADPDTDAQADPDVAISFAAGADLDPSWSAQWGDPFLGSTDFSVYAADDGNGAWSYQENATGCILGYWQGRVDGLDTSGGDSDASDQLLAIQFDADVAEVAPYAADDITFASLSGPIAARSVAGADSENGLTYIVAARAFAALGAGLVATLDCPEAIDVYTQWASLQADPGAYTAVVGPLG